MYIHKETQKVLRTHSEIRLHFSSTSLPAILTDEVINSLGLAEVKPVPEPEHDKESQKIVESVPVEVQGEFYQSYSIVDLSPEEIEEQKAINQEIINQKIHSLWEAADAYTSGYISGVAIGILTIGVLQQKPKALAVSAWSSSVWAEYYKRKALITIDSSDNKDFSSFGGIPYSVPELQEEIGV